MRKINIIKNKRGLYNKKFIYEVKKKNKKNLYSGLKSLSANQTEFKESNGYTRSLFSDIKKTPKFLRLGVPKLFYLCKMNFMNNVIGLYNKKFIYEVKKKNKKNLYSRLKSLSANQVKILLLFNLYEQLFEKVYVSDGSIAKKIGISREWVNKSKHGNLSSFLRVRNRGIKRTCITECELNILKDPQLVIYFMNQIRALEGVFKYNFTRFLKISYLNIKKNVNFTQKGLREIEIMSKFSDLICSDYLRSKKLTLKEEICLSVFPVSALKHAWSLFEGYPTKVNNKFRFLYSMAVQYCHTNNIVYLSQLSYWFFTITGFAYNIKSIKLGDSLTVAPKGVGDKRKQDASLEQTDKKKVLSQNSSFLDFLAENPNIKKTFCT